MPIFIGNGKCGHFAHIPKCGGTSVEEYAEEIGLSVAFKSRGQLATPVEGRWSVSTPQHIGG